MKNKESWKVPDLSLISSVLKVRILLGIWTAETQRRMMNVRKKKRKKKKEWENDECEKEKEKEKENNNRKDERKDERKDVYAYFRDLLYIKSTSFN